ncbi:hypothetical protein ABZP36_029310 [Zizania latifolia]
MAKFADEVWLVELLTSRPTLQDEQQVQLKHPEDVMLECELQTYSGKGEEKPSVVEKEVQMFSSFGTAVDAYVLTSQGTCTLFLFGIHISINLSVTANLTHTGNSTNTFWKEVLTVALDRSSNEKSGLAKGVIARKEPNTVECEDTDQHCQGLSIPHEEKVSNLQAALIHVARKRPKNAHAHFRLGLMYQGAWSATEGNSDI